jgi:hypothetical protein
MYLLFFLFLVGAAPFGYGDETVYGTEFVPPQEAPVYFRRIVNLPATVNLADPDTVFSLGLAADNRGEVYINGQLALQDPPGISHEFEYWNQEDAALSASLFQTGDNLIAVFMENDNPSSDAYMDVGLNVTCDDCLTPQPTPQPTAPPTMPPTPQPTDDPTPQPTATAPTPTTPPTPAPAAAEWDVSASVLSGPLVDCACAAPGVDTAIVLATRNADGDIVHVPAAPELEVIFDSLVVDGDEEKRQAGEGEGEGVVLGEPTYVDGVLTQPLTLAVEGAFVLRVLVGDDVLAPTPLNVTVAPNATVSTTAAPTDTTEGPDSGMSSSTDAPATEMIDEPGMGEGDALQELDSDDDDFNIWDWWLYLVIAGGVCLVCCICVCCLITTRRRRKDTKPPPSKRATGAGRASRRSTRPVQPEEDEFVISYFDQSRRSVSNRPGITMRPVRGDTDSSQLAGPTIPMPRKRASRSSSRARGSQELTSRRPLEGTTPLPRRHLGNIGTGEQNYAAVPRTMNISSREQYTSMVLPTTSEPVDAGGTADITYSALPPTSPIAAGSPTRAPPVVGGEVKVTWLS